MGRGTERMGWNQRKGLGYMADATNGTDGTGLFPVQPEEGVAR